MLPLSTVDPLSIVTILNNWNSSRWECGSHINEYIAYVTRSDEIRVVSFTYHTIYKSLESFLKLDTPDTKSTIQTFIGFHSESDDNRSLK